MTQSNDAIEWRKRIARQMAQLDGASNGEWDGSLDGQISALEDTQCVKLRVKNKN